MVIILKTFYIFKLNRQYFKLAHKKPENIYIILKTIYNHNNKDVLVAFDLFDEVCCPINKNFFNSYLFEELSVLEEYTKYRDVHMYHNYFTNEESKITINKSFIKIKSNKFENIFIKSLLDIENLFICNFNKNYYFLSSRYNRLVKKGNI